MTLNEIEVSARAFAERAHGAQRYGDQPYVTHLAAVRAVLAEYGIGGDTGVAAWLHDVVEDTPITIMQIDEAFGKPVADLVWAVTGVGESRRERNADAQAKIVAHPPAAILKLADRIANVEASAANNQRLLAMYRSEHTAFRAKLAGLTTEVPAADQMWQRLDALLA
ncbi:HD domain-containing protein [Nocardia jejuensis]|uniref:HD domain-containing protein n=1 Tax=Nocardia jejuensis TaxID=328049 RepID=UPI000829E82A|nr:HD domain-containing protein [Nocardia jejuensis]